MTDEERKTESRKKQNANLKPFRKYSELTPEELERQKAICTKGVQGLKEYHERQKDIKESAKVLLNTVLNREQCERMLDGVNTDLIQDGMTVQDVLLLSAFKEVLNGNVKGMEFLRDTSGFKQSVEITADITTEADRNLVDKVSKRLEILHKEA